MSKTTIVITRQLPDLLMQALEQLGRVTVLETATDDALAGAEVLVATAVDQVGPDLIEAASESLGLIANIGVGTDNIDLEAASRRGVMVSNTPVVTEDTADLTMALLLAACRRTSHCERLLREGDWATAASQLGMRVHGKTLGIIGFGAIGQAVARRAKGFGMTVCYHGPNAKPEADSELGARYHPSLQALLAETDILSLHCPLTAKTQHLLNSDTLAMVKPGAVIINTGRGPLIDEAALVQALESGHLGGAGLDVFEFEPEVNPALLQCDNVTLLPHIGSASAECRQDMAARAVANIQNYLVHGKPLDACV